MRAALERWLTARWYTTGRPPAWLRLLAKVYGRLAARRAARIRPQRVARPVLVVGNISVGGTGKTPLTIALVQCALELGLRPGVISRGYGGRAGKVPLPVDAATDPALCGDEPLLIARRTGVPVMVAPRRLLAAQALLARGDVDLLIADDGLQHHALGRDAEICVVDGARGFGNGYLLPAGPLREPPSRLAGCDLVVVTGEGALPDHPAALRMHLLLGDAQPLSGGPSRPLAMFRGGPVHAVAGIGHPERFFTALRAQGLGVIPHPFPDHYALRVSDLDFGDGAPILMTEKDGVKLTGEMSVEAWTVPVSAHFDPDGGAHMKALLTRLIQGMPDPNETGFGQTL